MAAPGAPGPWRCLDSTHRAPCEHCCEPPWSDLAAIELVHCRRRKTSGEKVLRAGLGRSPEWRDAAAREAAAVALSASAPAAARALHERDLSLLRKADLLALCCHWRYLSDAWRIRAPPVLSPKVPVASLKRKVDPAPSGRAAPRHGASGAQAALARLADVASTVDYSSGGEGARGGTLPPVNVPDSPSLPPAAAWDTASCEASVRVYSALGATLSADTERLHLYEAALEGALAAPHGPPPPVGESCVAMLRALAEAHAVAARAKVQGPGCPSDDDTVIGASLHEFLQRAAALLAAARAVGPGPYCAAASALLQLCQAMAAAIVETNRRRLAGLGPAALPLPLAHVGDVMQPFFARLAVPEAAVASGLLAQVQQAREGGMG